MQNRSKICCSTSSLVRAPTISSKRRAPPAGPRAGTPRASRARTAVARACVRCARAAPSSATWRTFEIAAVSRSGSPPVKRARDRCAQVCRCRRPSSPTPRTTSPRELDDRAAQIRLVRDDQPRGDARSRRARAIFGVSGSTAIEHDENEVGDLARACPRAPRLRARRYRRSRATRRIDQRDRQPFDVDASR